LVASGAAQSNFCRLTAASARRLGLDVVLVASAAQPDPVVALDPQVIAPQPDALAQSWRLLQGRLPDPEIHVVSWFAHVRKRATNGPTVRVGMSDFVADVLG
jgi:hypothetical protein